MGLERLVAGLGRVIVVLVAVTVAYGCVGVLVGVLPGVELVPDQSIPWPLAMPEWPLAGFLVALAVVIVQMPLVVMLRSRKRTTAERRRAEADDWLRGPSARAAVESGLALIRLTAFRAHARDAREVELSWNPQLDEVDEVVVYRSPLAFAASPEPVDGQVVVYSGDEAAYDDIALDDGCVYHYTAFARDRDGRWSSPAWAWAATPQLPLHTKLLGTLRMNRILVPGASR